MLCKTFIVALLARDICLLFNRKLAIRIFHYKLFTMDARKGFGKEGDLGLAWAKLLLLILFINPRKIENKQYCRK